MSRPHPAKLCRTAKNEQSLAHRTQTLAGALGRAGVSGQTPSRAEMATDQIGRHEAEDRLMVSLAGAVFDLVLPTEQEGVRSLFKASRDDTEFRQLFERAIGNFFAAELPREEGWRVYPGKFVLSDIAEGPDESACVVLVSWVDSAEIASLVEEMSI